MKIIKLVNLEENKNNLEYCEYLKKTYNDLIKIEKKVDNSLYVKNLLFSF